MGKALGRLILLGLLPGQPRLFLSAAEPSLPDVDRFAGITVLSGEHPLKMDFRQCRAILFQSDSWLQRSDFCSGAAVIADRHQWELRGLTPGVGYVLDVIPECRGAQTGCGKFQFAVRMDGGRLALVRFQLLRDKPEAVEIPFVAGQETVRLYWAHPHCDSGSCRLPLRGVRLRRLAASAGSGSPIPVSWKQFGRGHFHPKCGLANSLDGEAMADYTIQQKDGGPAEFELKLPEAGREFMLSAVFFSESDYAKVWFVEGLSADGRVVALAIGPGAGMQQELMLRANENFDRMRFHFYAYSGRQHLRLRLIWAVPVRPLENGPAFLEKAVAVSYRKPYGTGGVGAYSCDREALVRKLLAMPDWQCGEFALYFLLSLPRGTRAQIYGIRAPKTGAIHAVVECQEEGGRVVYDPTSGIAYRASLRELLAGEVDYDRIICYGRPPRWNFSPYIGKVFFCGAEAKKGASAGIFD